MPCSVGWVHTLSAPRPEIPAERRSRDTVPLCMRKERRPRAAPGLACAEHSEGSGSGPLPEPGSAGCRALRREVRTGPGGAAGLATEKCPWGWLAPAPRQQARPLGNPAGNSPARGLLSRKHRAGRRKRSSAHRVPAPWGRTPGAARGRDREERGVRERSGGGSGGPGTRGAGSGRCELGAAWGCLPAAPVRGSRFAADTIGQLSATRKCTRWVRPAVFGGVWFVGFFF